MTYNRSDYLCFIRVSTAAASLLRRDTLRWICSVAAVVLVALSGCGAPDAKFVRYETFAHRVSEAAEVQFSPQQRQDIDELLQGLFGTPDQPALPALEGADVSAVMNLTRLSMAAGPVAGDASGSIRGLYREHCAHCHGITGDGAGPTAVFLNPYPRDYRKGQFKFKSTPIGSKPTHDDLKRIVLDGIPGTAMPAFRLLPDLEVEALVDYVKYLAIRGEVERGLIMATTELEEGTRLVSIVAGSASDEQRAAQQEQLAYVKEIVENVVGKWQAASGETTEVPPRSTMSPEELTASVHRGRELFFGTVANCVKCHGDSALGDGQTTDYDEWTKEFIGDGRNLTLVSAFMSKGMLPPRTIIPRNLRHGAYRGGMRPVDIYWRIKNGIEGTPMPAASMKPEGDPHAKGLTTDDIWDLVNYVQALPYESISDPWKAAQQAEYVRERL
jgi:mono/diheme cytochrome c family protein